LGNSSYISDASGGISQHLEYFPFGEVFIEEQNSSYNTPYLFNGKELDDKTGLYYYGARYYDPVLSNWLSVDPLASSMPDWSPYNYTFNNPMRLTDPDGRAPSNAYCCGEPTPSVVGVLFEAFTNARAGIFNIGMRAVETAGFGDKNTSTRMRVNYDMYGGIPYGNPTRIVKEPKKGMLGELGDTVLDVVSVAPLAGPAKGSTAPFLAARAPSSIIPSVAKQFDNLQCMECSDAIVSALKNEGISGQILEYRTLNAAGKPSATNIVSKTNEAAGKLDAISTSGVHRGVLTDGKVYDNIHPQGINYSDWVDDFESLAPNFSVKKISEF